MWTSPYFARLTAGGCGKFLHYRNSKLMSIAVRPVHLKRTAQSFRQTMVTKATVVDVCQESPTVKRVVLQPSDSQFSFKAGQWLDVFIPGIDIVGGFSVCSCPRQLLSNGTFELAVKATPHPPALWVSEQCKSGDVIEVRVGGDFHFPPAQAAAATHAKCSPPSPGTGHGNSTSPGCPDVQRVAHPTSSTAAMDFDVLLIGGGVGINPLFSILSEVAGAVPAADNQSRPAGAVGSGSLPSEVCVRSATLLHSTQTMDELLFLDPMRQLARSERNSVDLQIHVCVTRGDFPAEQKNPKLSLHGGRVSRQLLSECLASMRLSNLLCYICGPPNMIEWVVGELHQLSVPDDQIHYEKWW